MVKITKVYTKTGDLGTTQLAAGKRVAKTSERIEAIGSLDELNTFIAFALVSFSEKKPLKKFQKKMMRIQKELFDLGAQLCVLKKYRRKNTPYISQKNIKNLENEIDEMNTTLPTLNSFILPGGGEISARLHLARVVCRRAERTLLHLNEIEKLEGVEVPYLNRLSDWLFVAARYVAAKSQMPEVLWNKKKKRRDQH